MLVGRSAVAFILLRMPVLQCAPHTQRLTQSSRLCVCERTYRNDDEWMNRRMSENKMLFLCVLYVQRSRQTLRVGYNQLSVVVWRQLCTILYCRFMHVYKPFLSSHFYFVVCCHFPARCCCCCIFSAVWPRYRNQNTHEHMRNLVYLTSKGKTTTIQHWRSAAKIDSAHNCMACCRVAFKDHCNIN